VDLAETTNLPVTSGLTEEQVGFLTQNGFVVIHSQEAQFNDIREQVAFRTGQPFYLTTDAAYHSLHITFDEMTKALEAQYLRRQMLAITNATLAEVQKYLPLVKGTSIEADTSLAAAYLAVASKLFNPGIQFDAEMEAQIAPPLEQIKAGGGQAPSILIPGFTDDYSAYRPVGHYAGKPALEAYFQGMTWLGRVNFRLKSDEADFVPSRAPLIITLAMRRATLAGRPIAESWAEIHGLLTFMIGPSDDAGPVEFATLMDQVYGTGLVIQGLADDGKWQQFLQSSAQLPAPRIISTFVNSLKDLSKDTGWRFMGQRFTLDGFIFQNLVFDRVGTQDKPRNLPSGLDVMAVFGSSVASSILGATGETAYANYSEQFSVLQQAVKDQSEAEWLDTFYSAWLYAFFPQLATKDNGFPAYMKTLAWGYKELNSALGSWAELKHDTILYAKMPERAGGGGPPMSGPAPAYVEPNPETFYRLAYAAQVIGGYLDIKLNWEGVPLDEPLPGDYMPNGLPDYVSGMVNLGVRFKNLGDLAAKELTGQPLSTEDYDLIQDCLGPVECLVFQSHTPYGLGGPVEPPLVPVVAAVAGGQENILEVAVGEVDRIYVVVPIDGKLQIAQGGVFSYYEFVQPRIDRLTDDAWRARLASEAVESPKWSGNFSLNGGKTASILAFRLGDVYSISAEGDMLNVRSSPTTSASVVQQLKTGDYVEISDGPVVANGYTWWKLKLWDKELGWAVENQEWYRRSTILLETP